jgi:hypothetical protein
VGRVSNAESSFFSGWQTWGETAFLKPVNGRALGHLKARDTEATAAGIDELKKAPPHCRAHWDSGEIASRQ